VKFSRKLPGKRIRRHINIKSVTLNVHSVHQPWTRMLAVAYESSGQPCHRFLRKVIPDHLQSTLLDCWWLTVVLILSMKLQNCNADYLVLSLPLFNSETCRRCYLTDARWFYLSIRMALQLTVHATQDRLRATAMTLLRSMYGHQTCQILIRSIIICGVPWLKPITSWISQAGQLSHKQLRSFLLCVW